MDVGCHNILARRKVFFKDRSASGLPIFRYFPLFSGFFRYFWPDPLSADPFPVFSIFSYFIFLFLNFLSLFVFIFCETARTRRFSVIFAKVQWHPCCLNSCSCCHTDTEVTDQARCTTRYKTRYTAVLTQRQPFLARSL